MDGKKGDSNNEPQGTDPPLEFVLNPTFSAENNETESPRQSTTALKPNTTDATAGPSTSASPRPLPNKTETLTSAAGSILSPTTSDKIIVERKAHSLDTGLTEILKRKSITDHAANVDSTPLQPHQTNSDIERYNGSYSSGGFPCYSLDVDEDDDLPSSITLIPKRISVTKAHVVPVPSLTKVQSAENRGCCQSNCMGVKHAALNSSILSNSGDVPFPDCSTVEPRAIHLHLHHDATKLASITGGEETDDDMYYTVHRYTSKDNKTVFHVHNPVESLFPPPSPVMTSSTRTAITVNSNKISVCMVILVTAFIIINIVQLSGTKYNNDSFWHWARLGAIIASLVIGIGCIFLMMSMRHVRANSNNDTVTFKVIIFGDILVIAIFIFAALNIFILHVENQILAVTKTIM